MITEKRRLRSQKELESFTAYCKAHPDERFWQAVRNWSGWPFIYANNNDRNYDTFYFMGRDQ